MMMTQYCNPMHEILFNKVHGAVTVGEIKDLLQQAAPAMATMVQKAKKVEVLLQKHKSSWLMRK